MENKNLAMMMPYVLPAVTVVALAILLAQPGFTGMAALPSSDAEAPGTDAGEIDALIRLSVPANQVMPEGSWVNVYIKHAAETADSGDIVRIASMPISEFVEASGRPFTKLDGRLFAINYSGPGYAGQNFSVGLSEFDVDRMLPSGSYVLRTEIAYNGAAITSSERTVEVPQPAPY